MKKIILSVFVASLAIAAQAQQPTDKKGMPERHHMKGKGGHHGMDLAALNLSEEQKAKFKANGETFRKQMQEIKSNESISAEAKKAKFMELRKQQKAAMDNILTKDQKTLLEKQKAEAREKHATQAKERGERMRKELGLTDDQSAKLKENRKATGEKMKAIRDNKSLSDDQKKEQVRSLMQAQREQMNSILTPEQQSKMKEMHHRKPGGDRKKTDKVKPASI